MLADLVRANLEREPARARLIDAARGTIDVTATDADVAVGIEFVDGCMRFGGPLGRPDLSIATTADILMSLTSVPLRFGLPDTFTAEGRRVARLLLDGQIEVHGLFTHLRLMSTLQRLFSVL